MNRRATWAVAAACLSTRAHGSWVDPDTPPDARQTSSLVDGRTFDLVFSDEFNVEGRTFGDGHDPRWTALHKNDYTNTALQFYDRDKVRTNNGCLNITTTAETTKFLAQNDKTLKYKMATKNFKSGMVQSWNKFCFTGGIVEVRAKLPGKATVGGLWPAIWLLGNLARATYVGSANWIWPWSFNECDRGLQRKQLVSACSPHPHYGFAAFTGRGAPEIDILEAMPGHQALPPSKVGKPYFSTSLQVAPGVPEGRPGAGGPPGPGSWYEGLEYGANSSQNIFFYGTLNVKKNPAYTYQSDAISGNTQLDKSLWGDFRTWRLEWALGASRTDASEGYVRWYMDDSLVYGITGLSLSRKMKGSMIPSEPQYVLLNTAMSSSWGFPQPCPRGCKCDAFDCRDPLGHWGPFGCGIAPGFCDTLPAHFLVDHVRVWQRSDDAHQKVGCSTPERPSKQWIAGHADSYKDVWDDAVLKPVDRGGAACATDADCGASEASGSGGASDRGASPPPSSCVGGGKKGRGGVCACGGASTGPRCLAHAGFDPVDWEAALHSGLGPPAPLLLPVPLASAVAALAAVFATAVALQVRKARAARTVDRVRLFMETNRPSAAGLQAESQAGGAAAGGLRPADGASGGRADEGSRLAHTRVGGARSYTLIPSASEVQLSRIPLHD